MYSNAQSADEQVLSTMLLASYPAPSSPLWLAAHLNHVSTLSRLQNRRNTLPSSGHATLLDFEYQVQTHKVSCIKSDSCLEGIVNVNNPRPRTS